MAGRSGTGLQILGVTVLTNLDAADIRQQGIAALPRGPRRAPRDTRTRCRLRRRGGVRPRSRARARNSRAAHGDRDARHPAARRRRRRSVPRGQARSRRSQPVPTTSSWADRYMPPLIPAAAPKHSCSKSSKRWQSARRTRRASASPAQHSRGGSHAQGLCHRSSQRHQPHRLGRIRRQGRRGHEEIRRQPDRARRQARRPWKGRASPATSSSSSRASRRRTPMHALRNMQPPRSCGRVRAPSTS